MSHGSRLDRLTPVVWIVAFVLGVVALGWGGWRVSAALSKAERAQLEADEGLAILAAMGPAPAQEFAAGDPTSSTGFTLQLQDALDQAQVAATALQSVTPRANRAGATLSHQIVMQPVPLGPGLRVLEGLTQDAEARVTSLDLRAPERAALDAERRETWRIEAELTTP